MYFFFFDVRKFGNSEVWQSRLVEKRLKTAESDDVGERVERAMYLGRIVLEEGRICTDATGPGQVTTLGSER